MISSKRSREVKTISVIHINKNNFQNEALHPDKPVLLDVRIPDEYRQGHIPGSKNVPLQSIDKVTDRIADKSTPTFVHCLSGARSRQTAAVLQQLGYTNVKNTGGISAYAGKVER